MFPGKKATAKYFSLAAIVLIAVVSGCTSPSPATGGGVIIEEFVTDFGEVYSGDTVKLSLLVRNTGSVDAGHVFAEVLGLDEAWYGQGENFPNEQECRHDSSGFSLSAPNPDYSVRGESHVCTWTYNAPTDIPKGMSVTHEATAMVFYDYHTDVVKTVTLLSYERMRELQQQGGAIPADTTSQTNSPVSITAATRSPIRIGNDEITFPLEIGIENTGGGIACRTGECKKAKGGNLNEVKLKIGFLSEGMSIAPDSGCQGFADGDGEYVSVWSGKPNKISCDIQVDNPSGITGPVQIPIRINAEYSYLIEDTLQIRVYSPY